MNAHDIAKSFFPEASDNLIEHIIYARTGFPCFWRFKPEDEEDIEKCFRRQLAEYKEALKLGVRLCEFCNEPAQGNDYVCNKCRDTLDRAKSHSA